VAEESDGRGYKNRAGGTAVNRADRGPRPSAQRALSDRDLLSAAARQIMLKLFHLIQPVIMDVDALFANELRALFTRPVWKPTL
jgi:hypothetical protein